VPGVAAELRKGCILLLQGDLVMVSRNRFVQEQAFEPTGDIIGSSIENGHIKYTRSFSVGCARHVFGAGTGGAEGLGLPDLKGTFGYMMEHLLQVGLYAGLDGAKSVKHILRCLERHKA